MACSLLAITLMDRQPAHQTAAPGQSGSFRSVGTMRVIVLPTEPGHLGERAN